MGVNYSKIGFEEMQYLQTELLVEVDRFCSQNSISYFLAYGTLLGAVRHGGHIPWDDDSDVVMPRPDFERFLREYKENEDFKVITYRDDEGLLYNFARIVNKNTFSLSGKSVSHGINIDIYPLEGLPEGEKPRTHFLKRVYRWIYFQNFLIRAYSWFRRRNYNKISSVVLYVTRHVCRKIDCLVTKYDYQKSNYVTNIVGERKPIIFPKSVFGNSSTVFDGKQFSSPLGTDTFLTIVYNNYMELPPEDERVPYHGDGNYYWK